jgi:hypothetical protein
MRIRGEATAIAVVLLVVSASCARQSAPAPAPAPVAPSPAAPQAGRAGQPQQGGVPVMPDSIAASNDRYVAQITAQIAGKENLPAEQVFKDIQLLKGTPASRVLAIMNAGYSRALGVSCTNCHDASAWESNVKPDKKTARGMIRMVTMINEGNKAIPEFEGDVPVINCAVCHRGSRRPQPMPRPAGARGGAPGGAPGAPPRTID